MPLCCHADAARQPDAAYMRYAADITPLCCRHAAYDAFSLRCLPTCYAALYYAMLYALYAVFHTDTPRLLPYDADGC